MGIHDGHRQRLRRHFIENGLDDFDDHNVLELLLCFAIARQDVNPVAHRLLDHFGSLEKVFEATHEELVAVPGIGENAAALIRLCPALGRRHAIDKTSAESIINSTETAGSYLVPRFMHEQEEVVYVVCLDAKNKVICCKEMFRGTPNSAEIRIRKIMELVITKKATGIILAHNHTSGIAIPSIEDEESTRRIKTALAHLGVSLIDHIVVAGDDYVSMAESNLL
jgi:DNA repair protein RadC